MDEVYTTSKLQLIRQLELDGILDFELCPEPDYWHWRVAQLDLLPEILKKDYEAYGEVRLYS